MCVFNFSDVLSIVFHMMMTWVTHCLTTIYRNIAVIRHSCRPRWLYNLHGRLITSVCTTRSQPHCDRHEEAGNNRDNGSSHNVKPLYPLVSLGAVFLGYIMSQKSKSSCLLKQEKADHSSSVESTNKLSLNEAIEVARDLCQRVKVFIYRYHLCKFLNVINSCLCFHI